MPSFRSNGSNNGQKCAPLYFALRIRWTDNYDSISKVKILSYPDDPTESDHLDLLSDLLSKQNSKQ